MSETTCEIQEQAPHDWFTKEPPRLRNIATQLACQAAAVLQNLRGNCCRTGFGILMYHRLTDRVAGVDPPTANVTPGNFRRQLIGLLERGFQPWPLPRLVEAHRESRPIPPTAFAITFDDGYENNYLNALPILKEFEAPATIFLATEYLDTDRPFPFDDWSATGTKRVPTSSWRPLTSRQCHELLDSGLIDIGAHTHSHRRFLGRPEEFRRDMTTCLEILRDRFGMEMPTFSFPYGHADEELIHVAKQVGASCSLSTRSRRVQPHESEYEWGRLWAADEDSPALLAAKISGWYEKVATAGRTFTSPLFKWGSANGLEERITDRKANGEAQIAKGEFASR